MKEERVLKFKYPVPEAFADSTILTGDGDAYRPHMILPVAALSTRNLRCTNLLVQAMPKTQPTFLSYHHPSTLWFRSGAGSLPAASSASVLPGTGGAKMLPQPRWVTETMHVTEPVFAERLSTPPQLPPPLSMYHDPPPPEVRQVSGLDFQDLDYFYFHAILLWFAAVSSQKVWFDDRVQDMDLKKEVSLYWNKVVLPRRERRDRDMAKLEGTTSLAPPQSTLQTPLPSDLPMAAPASVTVTTASEPASSSAELVVDLKLNSELFAGACTLCFVP